MFPYNIFFALFIAFLSWFFKKLDIIFFFVFLLFFYHIFKSFIIWFFDF